MLLDGRRITACLVLADRFGFELFELDDNSAHDENLNYRKHGTFHFAIQDPDLEGLLEQIVVAGG